MFTMQIPPQICAVMNPSRLSLFPSLRSSGKRSSDLEQKRTAAEPGAVVSLGLDKPSDDT